MPCLDRSIMKVTKRPLQKRQAVHALPADSSSSETAPVLPLTAQRQYFGAFFKHLMNSSKHICAICFGGYE